MPISPAAESELRSILNNFRAAHSGVAVPTGAGKALEAFIFFKLAQTVKQHMAASWLVTLRRGDGSPLPTSSTFDLPGGPSRIQASSLTAPCYALLTNTADYSYSFELHGSLRWVGRSGTKHEVDISVLPWWISENIRNNGGGYPHGLPIAAIECKDKDGVGNLDEARQTLARMFDVVLVTQPYSGWACRNYETNTYSQWGHKSSKYISSFQKSHIGIVRAGTVSSSVRPFMDHYCIKVYTSIYNDPTQIANLQSDFRINLWNSFHY